MNRARRERLATGATVLRSRVATACAKRASDARGEAFEHLLHAIDSVLLALEPEPAAEYEVN